MTDWYSSLFMSEEEKEERRNRRSYIRGGRNDRRVDGFDAYVRERARPNQLPEEPAGMRQMLDDVRVERGRQAARAGDPEAGANPVPFSVASGQRERPFGNDFAAWVLYLDAQQREEEMAAQPTENAPWLEPEYSNWGEASNQPGTANQPARLRPRQSQLSRPLEPPSAPDRVQAPGMESAADVARNWLAAVERARSREREYRPTVTDSLFRLIFGTRPQDGLDRLRNENQELQQMIARGEATSPDGRFESPLRVLPRGRRSAQEPRGS